MLFLWLSSGNPIDLFSSKFYYLTKKSDSGGINLLFEKANFMVLGQQSSLMTPPLNMDDLYLSGRTKYDENND